MSFYNMDCPPIDPSDYSDKKQQQTCGLVIVETRELEQIREVVKNHIEFTGWPVMFFHGAHNERQVKEKLKGLDVAYFNIGKATLNTEDYNKLLTSELFWRAIPYDKVLIFQHDSRLLRTGIEEFLQWDYVGAPWIFQKNGGNGGLSLRSKDAMLRAVKQKRWNPAMGNEDIFFSNIMYRDVNYKLAPPSVCQQFSCEVIYKLGTFGVHAIEKWMSAEQVTTILNQYNG